MSGKEWAGPLFDTPQPRPAALYRHEGPPESALGAHEAVGDGAVREAQRAAYEAVKADPGKTCTELETDAGVLGRTLGRRLNELEKAGLVTRGPSRRCSVTGRMAATWSPA